MRRGRQLLLVLAGIATVLLVAEVGLRVGDGWLPRPTTWPTVETELKSGQLAEKSSWSVVFLGSSITEAGIDPERIAGADAYNAALPFSTAATNLVWYREMFDPRPGRTVVLGIPPRGFAASDDVGLDVGIAAVLEDAAARPLELSRRRGLLADWFQLRSRERSLSGDLWTDRGHQTGYYRRELGAALPVRAGETRVGDETKSAIADLAALIDSQGGILVLMVEPLYSASVEEDAATAYIESLKSLAFGLGVVVWDCFSPGWDRSLYADPDHFNEAGTVAFTEFVARELEKLSRGGGDQPAAGLHSTRDATVPM